MVQGSSQKAEISNTSDAPVVSGAMDPALKAKWVEALRSGEYEQGCGEFLADDKYCCLGVLCVVSDNPVHVVAIGDKDDNYDFIREVVPSEFISRLYRMNDGGKGFPEIADYIEANIPTTDNSVAEDRS